MAWHQAKVEHYKKNEETKKYETTPRLISNILSLHVQIGLGEKADSFDFSIPNFKPSDFSQVKVDDRIKIYGRLSQNDSWTLLLDGIVQEKKSSRGTDNKSITFTGLNRLEKLFNALVTTSTSNTYQTANEYIQDIIDQVNDFNSFSADRKIKTAGTIYQLPDSENIRYVRGYEKAFKLIEELSQPDFTGGTTFDYWMDENNYFHWQPRTESFNPQEENGEISWNNGKLKSESTTKGMFDIVNYIILNSGKSPYGASILTVDYDEQSIAKHGWKVKLKSDQGLADSVLKQEKTGKESQFQAESKFPKSSAYPFTFSWGVTVADDGEFNSEFVEEVQRQGEQLLAGILNKNKGSKYKTKLETVADFEFNQGMISLLQLPYLGWSTGEELRLQTYNFNFSSDGWSTDLSFEQDADIESVTV